MTVESGLVESGGHRHRYYSALPNGKPRATLLAIHGFGTTGERTWRHIAGQLTAADIALYAPDLLGAGESDKPDVVYGLEFFAEHAVSLADALGLDRPVLIGHSMGGKIASATAALYPGKFSGLILINSGGFDRGSSWVARASGFPLLVRLIRNDWFYENVLPRTPFGPLFPGEESRDHFLRLQHSHRALDLDLTGIRRKLAEFREPVLVVWGARDPLMPPSTPLRIKAAFPGAALHLIANAGHAPMKDAPDALAAEITRFVLTPGRLPRETAAL